jgi:hypothetical protein
VLHRCCTWCLARLLLVSQQQQQQQQQHATCSVSTVSLRQAPAIIHHTHRMRTQGRELRKLKGICIIYFWIHLYLCNRCRAGRGLGTSAERMTCFLPQDGCCGVTGAPVEKAA